MLNPCCPRGGSPEELPQHTFYLPVDCFLQAVFGHVPHNSVSKLMYLYILYIFSTSPDHVPKSNIPAVCKFPCCIIYSPHLYTHSLLILPILPPQPVLVSPNEANAQNSWCFKAEHFDQQWVKRRSLGFGTCTSTHLQNSALFLSPLSRSWQLLGGEESWLSLLPQCLPTGSSLLCECISPLLRKLERNISA